MELVANLVDDLEPGQLGFRWGAGSVALDLVATVGERWHRSFERLRSADDLARWIVESGLVTTRPIVRADDLDRARGLRSSIYACAMAAMTHQSPTGELLHQLNRTAGQPDLPPRLDPAWHLYRDRDATASAVLSTIARDALELLATVDHTRLRECHAADCSRLFIDRTRAGNRRWCSSEVCGNRAKTKAYRRRKRQRT